MESTNSKIKSINGWVEIKPEIVTEDYVKFFKKTIREATGDRVGGAGGYIPPLQPGEREFAKTQLGPFNIPVSDYKSPLVQYDSYDHHWDLRTRQIKELEKEARKVTDYIKRNPYSTFSDEDGNIINATPSGKLKKDPFNLEVVPVERSRKKINEITTSTTAGEYNGPQELGMRKWAKSELGAFSVDSSHPANVEQIKRSIKDNISKVVGGWEPREGTFEVPTEPVKSKKEKRVKPHGELTNDPIEWYKNFNKKRSGIKKPSKNSITEDLAVWFGDKKKPKGSSQPKGPWVDICRKVDGKHPPCGRSDASTGSYPKCRAAGVAGKMSDSAKKAACQQKRRAEKSDPQSGKGQKPVMTSYKPRKKTNENMNRIITLTESDIEKIVMRVLNEEINISNKLNQTKSLSQGLSLTCVKLNEEDPKLSETTDVGPYPWNRVKYDKSARPVKIHLSRPSELPRDAVYGAEDENDEEMVLGFEEVIEPSLKEMLTDKKYVMITYKTPALTGKQYCKVNGPMDPQWDENLFKPNEGIIDPYTKLKLD